MRQREQIEWSELWVEAANSTLLPRVLLVGDSITKSYYSRTSNCLKNTFACARLVTSKCVCDPLFLKELRLLLDEYEFAIIHFNNGLHGGNDTADAYAEGLQHVLDFMVNNSGGSELIWASTTPVWQKNSPGIIAPKTDRVLAPRTDCVRERNRIAATLAAERGIAVNDLFAAVINHPEYSSDDGVHFKEEGQAVLGKLVAQTILGVTDNSAKHSPPGDVRETAPGK